MHTKKQRIENLLAGIIDCNYTIARLEKDSSSQAQVQQWHDHKKDLLKILTNLRSLNH